MVKLIIEGGAGKDSVALQIELRKAFNQLLKKSGLTSMPRIVAAGGRTQAYDQYKNLIERYQNAVLLVDSEKEVADKYNEKPWDFLKSFESWDWLEKLDDRSCHLMTQCMEAWFIADKNSLIEYYGNNFLGKSLPRKDIEKISKDSIEKILDHAASNCAPKKGYDKGRDSFKILSKVNPVVLRNSSAWADRFFTILQEIMSK